MSKKLFLAVLPLLALAMASCSRGNGGTSSAGGNSSGGSAGGDSSVADSSAGDESSEDESSEGTSLVESAHTFTIGSTEYALYVDDTFDPDTDVWGGVAKFVSAPLDVTAGDSIAVTANPSEAEPVVVYKNGFNANNNVAGTEPASYTVKASAEGAVLSLYQYEKGWAFNLTGPSSGEGGDLPTTGFAIVVTNSSSEKTYHVAEDNGMQYGKQEYKALGVTIASGDTITCYNADALVEWPIVALNSASVAGFTADSTGVHSSTAGTFDIYIQLAYENDTIYVGPHSA